MLYLAFYLQAAVVGVNAYFYVAEGSEANLALGVAFFFLALRMAVLVALREAREEGWL